jgi:hypothetical protein
MNPTSAPTPPRLAFRAAIAAQVLLVAIVALGDIGFDHPGRFGLDFGHLLLLALLWLLATMLGFVFAWKARTPGLLTLQCALSVATTVGGWVAIHHSEASTPIAPTHQQSAPADK